MVEPERDVPGMSAKHCMQPTAKASLAVISSIVGTRGVMFLRSW